jgi:DNA-binding NarL/FixJ family response regulator
MPSVRSDHAGGHSAGPATEHARRALGLTGREREIVSLIDQGFSNREIAAELGIELSTVKNHVHHILEKLHAHRRTEAAACVAGRRPRAS